MSLCKKCNPPMSGRTREYIKNSESYKTFLRETHNERMEQRKIKNGK